jgi:Asp-tRNA(Asn)/Glu-tRNA(Gln) amidotransferase A subunit family amidase
LHKRRKEGAVIALQEVQELTIQEIHLKLQTGEMSVRDLVQAYLARIAKFDQKGSALNAVIQVNPFALTVADELDAARRRGEPCGLLHGIPVLVKDNIETAGLETTGGSLSMAGYIPQQDAFLISRLKQAGAVILAKTNLHEFAIWGETISSRLGQTLNP